jgi:Ion channel
MFFQLFIGSVVICCTIVVESAFMMSATNALPHINKWLRAEKKTMRSGIVVFTVTLWLLAAHSIAVWMWAIMFLLLGTFDALEPALYFSIVSFTTLGFGDIILPVETRLLSGLIAANGMIAFGLSTAFFVEFLIRLRKAHFKSGQI